MIDELSGRAQQVAAVDGLLRDLYERSWRYPAWIIAHSSCTDGKRDEFLARNAWGISSARNAWGISSQHLVGSPKRMGHLVGGISRGISSEPRRPSRWRAPAFELLVLDPETEGPNGLPDWHDRKGTPYPL